jgi:hypothetical protein
MGEVSAREGGWREVFCGDLGGIFLRGFFAGIFLSRRIRRGRAVLRLHFRRSGEVRSGRGGRLGSETGSSNDDEEIEAWSGVDGVGGFDAS